MESSILVSASAIPFLSSVISIFVMTMSIYRRSCSNISIASHLSLCNSALFATIVSLLYLGSVKDTTVTKNAIADEHIENDKGTNTFCNPMLGLWLPFPLFSEYFLVIVSLQVKSRSSCAIVTEKVEHE